MYLGIKSKLTWDEQDVPRDEEQVTWDKVEVPLDLEQALMAKSRRTYSRGELL